MKQRQNLVRVFPLGLLFTLLLVFALPFSVLAGSAAKVAILPFAVNASDDLSYLQNGVRTMLTSRLAANAGVEVLDRFLVDTALPATGQAVSAETAARLAQQLGADHLVTGSLTSMGGGVSIDARVTPAAGGEAQIFYATAAKQEEVITAVNGLSWDIAEKVFGAKRPVAYAAPPGQAPAAAQQAAVQYQTAHPERAFLAPGQAGSPFARAYGAAATFSKTQNIDLKVIAMDSGDIDGDGNTDIVMASTSEVRVYSLQADRLFNLGAIPLLDRASVHGVTVGDLNGNGRAEVYISADDKGRPCSLAAEWNGQDFTILFEDARWYIRAFDHPAQGMILLGQRPGVTALTLPGVFKLMRVEGALHPEDRIPLPEFVNLFDFTLGDLDGDGGLETIAISAADHLYILKGNGRLLWESTDKFGGSSRYIGEDKAHLRKGLDLNSATSPDTDPTPDTQRLYVPARLLVTDLDGDGKGDVVVNKNISVASRVMKQYKKFPSGELHIMSWNGLGLVDLWTTRPIDGYIAEYQIDRSIEGMPRLLVALALRSGFLDTSGATSTVLLYALPTGEEKTE